MTVDDIVENILQWMHRISNKPLVIFLSSSVQCIFPPCFLIKKKKNCPFFIFLTLLNTFWSFYFSTFHSTVTYDSYLPVYLPSFGTLKESGNMEKAVSIKSLSQKICTDIWNRTRWTILLRVVDLPGSALLPTPTIGDKDLHRAFSISRHLSGDLLCNFVVS